jgi:hypothetical protein
MSFKALSIQCLQRNQQDNCDATTSCTRTQLSGNFSVGVQPSATCNLGDISNATLPVSFDETGDPVSCKFWYRVCWACETYQRHCTRNVDCLTYKFLQRQDDAASNDDVVERDQAAESNRRRL